MQSDRVLTSNSKEIVAVQFSLERNEIETTEEVTIIKSPNLTMLSPGAFFHPKITFFI